MTSSQSAVALETSKETSVKDTSADTSARETTGMEESAPDVADVINNVTLHPRADHAHLMRVAEALLFASSEPLSNDTLAQCLPEGTDIEAVIASLQEQYRERGVNLVKVADKWAFRTAQDLSFLLRREAVEQKRLSKAALETLAIIAYHQPVTRSDIEEIRGVSISKGTLDILLDMGWAKMRGRRRTPGKPITYGTTPEFLEHFGLTGIGDLPGLNELKGAGLLSSNLPSGFTIPMPRDEDDLGPDEMSLEEEEDEPPLEMHLPDLTRDPDFDSDEDSDDDNNDDSDN